MATIPGVTGNNGTPSTTSQQTLDGKAFMTLLLAQLQHQDPFQPMDPSQMVGQLVQFNSLNELIKIRQSLEMPITVSGASAAPANQNSNQS